MEKYEKSCKNPFHSNTFLKNAFLLINNNNFTGLIKNGFNNFLCFSLQLHFLPIKKKSLKKFFIFDKMKTYCLINFLRRA